MSLRPDFKGTVELVYPAQLLSDGRSVCGSALARELIDDALRLLLGARDQDMDAAWDDFTEMAFAAAHRCKGALAEGDDPGLVLTVRPLS